MPSLRELRNLLEFCRTFDSRRGCTSLYHLIRMSNSNADPMNLEIEEAHNDNQDDEAEESSSMVSPPPFLPDQRVLCRDQNNDAAFYESVIRKVRFIDGNSWQFFIHYLGWNSRWDRWVSSTDLLVDTPENRKQHLYHDQQQSQQPQPSTKKRKTHADSSSSSRRRKAETGASSSVLYYQDYCELPFTLKTILVEDYEKITRRSFDLPLVYDCELEQKPARSIHNLPSAISAKQVLQHYQRKRGGTGADKEKQQHVRQFCNGLTKIFEEALPVCLLYPQERPQYESIIRSHDSEFKGKALSEIYGCEFLLRLMVRLPKLLQAEPKPETSLVMGPLIADLIVLLQKNRQACFKGSYREPNEHELLDWEKAVLASFRTTNCNE